MAISDNRILKSPWEAFKKTSNNEKDILTHMNFSVKPNYIIHENKGMISY